jgi:hypothetical protein
MRRKQKILVFWFNAGDPVSAEEQELVGFCKQSSLIMTLMLM